MKTVKMVRRIRDAHYQELKDKTWDERIAFYKEQARTLRKELGAGQQQQSDQKEEAA